MKRMVLALSAVVLMIAAAGFFTLQLFPGAALSALQGFAALSGGYESKTVELDGYTAHYYEAGPEEGPVLVLLHGLIDDKNSFVPAAEDLSASFRVILPDLQGHGDNVQTPGRDYSIRGQVDFVADLLEALDIEELVIGGNSMGGQVAAAFALTYPDQVRRLMLLNATGMLLDAPSTYSAYPDDIDVAYLNEMYANVFINPPPIPGPIMRHLAEDLNAKAPFYNQLIDAVVDGKNYRLDDQIGTLAMPTLVIWGTDDRLVPIHYAEAYHAALPNSDLLILEAGHAPQLELPDAVSDAMMAFIGTE